MLESEEVLKLAKLSRLSISEEEIPAIKGHLDKMLDHLDALKALDLSHVEPMTAVENGETILRETACFVKLRLDDYFPCGINVAIFAIRVILNSHRRETQRKIVWFVVIIDVGNELRRYDEFPCAVYPPSHSVIFHKCKTIFVEGVGLVELWLHNKFTCRIYVAPFFSYLRCRQWFCFRGDCRAAINCLFWEIAPCECT